MICVVCTYVYVPSDAASLVTMTGVEELSLTVEETTLSALAAIFHSMTIKNLRLRLSSDFSPTVSKGCLIGDSLSGTCII